MVLVVGGVGQSTMSPLSLRRALALLSAISKHAEAPAETKNASHKTMGGRGVVRLFPCFPRENKRLVALFANRTVFIVTTYHVTLHTPCYTTPCCTTPCHATLHHVMPNHTASWDTIPCHATPYHAIQYHTVFYKWDF